MFHLLGIFDSGWSDRPLNNSWLEVIIFVILGVVAGWLLRKNTNTCRTNCMMKKTNIIK
jgi:hypothetical protein